MKIRVEVGCDEDEIVIRCREKTREIEKIESALHALPLGEPKREILLYSSGAEFYIPLSEILYFESAGGKVYAHTARAVYSTDKKLFELEEELAASFVRVAKSTIVNVYLVM